MIQTKSSTPSTSSVSPADACAAAIAEYRAEAEQLRRLPDPLVATLREAGAFGLLTPRERGGSEQSLTATSHIYEALGRLDGSVAWNVWNGNLGFSAAMLAPEAADAIWPSGHDPIVANSARPSGQATQLSDGALELSGRWEIVSAIEIADWVAVFAFVAEDDGSLVMTPHGPDLRVFYLPRADVEVVDTWTTNGMRGTGSHTVVIDRVRVAEAFTVSPFAPSHVDRPLYRIPAFTLASTGSAPIVIGIAQSAIDEVARVAAGTRQPDGSPLAEQPHVASRLGAEQTKLDAARALLYACTAAIDDAALEGRPIDEDLRARLRAAMSHAALTSREVLNATYELASSTALYAGNAIEQIVRDGLVACQHGLLARTVLDARGRLILGLPSGAQLL